MLAGDLESAIESYTRALEKAQAGTAMRWPSGGIALALDRKRRSRARVERLQRAFGAGGEGAARTARRRRVFVPAYEVHAYEALGHEARAQLLAEPDEQSAALRAAGHEPSRFIAGAAHAQRTCPSGSRTSRRELRRDSARASSRARQARRLIKRQRYRRKPALKP